MFFSIFGRFLMELGPLVVTVRISRPRSPRIMRQIIKIRLFRPFYEVLSGLPPPRAYPPSMYFRVPIAKTHFGEIVGGGAQPGLPQRFPQNRPRSGAKKTHLSYRFLFGKHIFVKSWGGYIPRPGPIPPYDFTKNCFRKREL